MKGREARPGSAVARAIGKVVAALVVAAVVLGASPQVGYCGCDAIQHTMLVTNKSNVQWSVLMDVTLIGAYSNACPMNRFTQSSTKCRVDKILQPGEQAGCSAYGTPREDHASAFAHFTAQRYGQMSSRLVWDITFDMAAGDNVELGLAPDGKATLDCGNIHYWTYDSK